MSVLRRELINAVKNKAYALTDYNNDIDKRHEFRKKMILDDKSLTNDEKSEAISNLTDNYDQVKIIYNEGKKRNCENCQLECLATLFCELCIRNYLKANFSNWSSGNIDIDHLIQNCQIETIYPKKVIEWIPYNNFQNIKYLTQGGFSEIYTADWIDGFYCKWDSKEQQLKRFGTEKVILKRLENVKSANRSWFDEAKSHLTIGNKSTSIVKCFGLTQNPSNKDYILVIYKYDIDLRNYLKQNHNQLTWKKRINISYNIIRAAYYIHKENANHRDLHSGNILYQQNTDVWRISDLGFCGPANKPLGSIYGNLPYVAPEVIAGKGYTFKSDIYSIGMLMWEISSGQMPFANFEYSDYDLAMNIINGMRPKIGSEIPLEYKELMQQCWDADPEKRPDINTLGIKIQKLNVFYKDENEKQTDNNNNILQLNTDFNTISSSVNSLIKKFSKIHIFEGLPVEPRNATEEEQEAFHSKPFDFTIPDNIEDMMKSENQTEQNDFTMIDVENNDEKNKSKRIYSNNSDDEEDSKSKKIKLENNNGKYDKQYHTYNEVEHMQRNYIASDIVDDVNEIYNDPNLHAEEQDELEIPEGNYQQQTG